MAKWDTITSDFPGTSLPANFYGYGIYTVSGNKVRYSITGSNYAGLIHYGQDLTGSYVLSRVEPGATGYASLIISTGGTIRGRIYTPSGVGGNIEFRVNATTLLTVAYNATTHAWWRIREASGTLYLDTNDGTGWTNRASAVHGVTLTSCDMEYEAGGGSATSEAAFSKFNLPPVGGAPAASLPLFGRQRRQLHLLGR